MDTTTAQSECAFKQIQRVSRRKWLVAAVRSHLKHDGFIGTVRYTFMRLGILKKKARPARTIEGECLDLRPGELVEVKSREEIEAALDDSGSTRGLFFMDEMWNFCGRRFRVLRRVETIMIETTAEMRPMKHTVLLEGANCDGSAHKGCDSYCYHYWREAWLRRVEEP